MFKQPFRLTNVLIIPCFLALLAGCDSPAKKAKSKGPSDTALQRDQLSKIDAWAVEAPMVDAVELGVIRQRILYDYHFVEGSERLTPVGKRDARILARHFKGTDWVLNVKQGSADDQLYKSKIAAVVVMMAGQGISSDQLAIVDGYPGGSGAASSDARRIRADSIKGAGSLGNDDSYNGGETIVRPIDTPLEGGF